VLLLAAPAAVVLILLTLLAPTAEAERYKPKLTAESTGGAGMDRYWNLGSRALRRGAKGHDVRVLQDYLRRSGLRVKIDGVYGSSTIRVVRLFERNNGRRADGRLSLADIRFLRGFVERGGVVARARGIRAVAATADQAGLNADGTAVAPANAPDAVKAIIEAGNRIALKPYVYGGGHGKWEDRGYDCSGSVSYALHGGGLLDRAMPSGSFTSWGESGAGEWVTIYANGGHMYMTVAGLRFDTSGRSKTGSRWQVDMRSSRGYTLRHPAGL
jgi:peptidoglycan hydrolase-like protein with peptidoglycan-binding domain